MDRSLDSSSLTSLETMPSPDVKDQMPSVQMRSATSNQNLPREISKVVTSNYPSSSLSESSVTLSTGMKMSQYPGGLSWSHDVWWVWCIFLAEFSVFHHFNFKSSIAILPTYEKEGSYPSKNRNGNYWSLNSLSLKCTFFHFPNGQSKYSFFSCHARPLLRKMSCISFASCSFATMLKMCLWR